METMGEWWDSRLQRPEWQTFRAVVLDAKGTECEHCGLPTSSPRVHHCRYSDWRDPWEYSLDEVKVLCPDCHETLHNLEREFLEFADEVDVGTLTLLCQIFGEFKRVEHRHQAVLFQTIYGFFKKERERVQREGSLYLDEEYIQQERHELRNFLLGLDESGLDPLLDATEILRSFPKSQQSLSLVNLFRFLLSWTPPKDPSHLAPLILPKAVPLPTKPKPKCRPSFILHDPTFPFPSPFPSWYSLNIGSLLTMRQWLAASPHQMPSIRSGLLCLRNDKILHKQHPRRQIALMLATIKRKKLS